ncbi:tRNA lysidine(34) synthetase TilS [Hylemonella sp. W303a]|uniref:tRNA lysidine(34) synthetase TilS n=1 Tax=Hylemonella sp. W303a TaxID=3389873 RepID=UPI00396B1A95
MAATPTPRAPSNPSSAAPAFTRAIARFQPGLPLAVAFSGGADSTALLRACAERWPGQVQALHVHHGLQAAADGFEAQVRATCEQLNIPLHARRVDARHTAGQSPEDAARGARYAALSEAALSAGVSDVALAQHADDQVETLLLALSRGAGLPGLASMPDTWARGGLRWHRPLLEVPGAELRAWLQARGLRAGEGWVEDPSNADERYTRNRIRARLLPVLGEVFPQFRATFARSAAHAAQAQRLLDELAAQDAAATGVGLGPEQGPRIAALRALSRDRQANLLRHWLRRVHALARPEGGSANASAAQLEELLDQIAACVTRGHHIELKVGAGRVERRGEILAWYNPAA